MSISCRVPETEAELRRAPLRVLKEGFERALAEMDDAMNEADWFDGEIERRKRIRNRKRQRKASEAK